MRKLTILFLVLSMVLTNVLIPISAGAEELFYMFPASGFTDINNHWASESIITLVERDILAGYPDRTFKPDNQVTRGEYLTSLFKTVCVLDESIVSKDTPEGDFYLYDFRENERRNYLENFPTAEYEPSYDDLKNHWSKNYVAWVKKYCDKKKPDLFNKIFPGTSFYPDKPITREEAVLVTIAFMAPPVRSRGIQFKDVTPDYAFYNEIMNLVNNGIINGFPDGTFKPKENITRAATAVIMTNVLKEIAYNVNFFASPDTYSYVIDSSNDSDYVAIFMTEEMYQDPPTELDKKYVAGFKADELNRQMLHEFADAEIYANEELGLEFGTDEYYEKLSELEELIHEKYDKIKKEEIPYYEPKKDRLEILKELEQKDYWNKAGLYYWIYKYDPNASVEYLVKAEAAYSIDKNGKDDLYKIYEELIQYYVWQEGNKQKAIEYVEKANGLFVPNEYGEAYVANMQDIRYYTFAAYYLANLGEYNKALNYMEKFFDKEAESFDIYFALERGALMYLSGQKDKALQYLKENLNILEKEEYVDESLRDKYIWAIKSIERLNTK